MCVCIYTRGRENVFRKFPTHAVAVAPPPLVYTMSKDRRRRQFDMASKRHYYELEVYMKGKKHHTTFPRSKMKPTLRIH